ncbi:MAG: TlpA family protein disulfide reductase [Desulfobulbaceae bacterium]|nr:TlpA family protein disulfide reductase [Desulfobulbaceae bacterium]
MKYKAKGVAFLGLFASKDKEIKAFADKFNLTYPVGKESGIATILWVKAIPETLFIDREGRIAKRYSGTINYE